MELNKWDVRFFGLASLIASWSEDRSRKIGAVIVGPPNDIRGIGFNGMPRGVNAKINSRHCRGEGEKYYWFEHAERNAIYNAARSGVMTYDCRIYCTHFPCADCMRAVIQCGIKELNSPTPPDNDKNFLRSFEIAIKMAEEAGIKLRLFNPDELPFK